MNLFSRIWFTQSKPGLLGWILSAWTRVMLRMSMVNW